MVFFNGWKAKRRDDMVLSHAREAPALLDELLLDLASDIAPADALLGEASPEYVRLACEIAELSEHTECRGLVDRFLDALRDALRP